MSVPFINSHGVHLNIPKIVQPYTFTMLFKCMYASVCCAAVRFVIVALLFIESLPYFHSVV